MKLRDCFGDDAIKNVKREDGSTEVVRFTLWRRAYELRFRAAIGDDFVLVEVVEDGVLRSDARSRLMEAIITHLIGKQAEV